MIRNLQKRNERGYIQLQRVGAYLIKNFIGIVVSIFLLSIVIFFMARVAPGDPLKAYYGEQVERMTVEEKERAIERLGLNEPLLTQYMIWLKNSIQGDFGISFQYKQPVSHVISNVIGNTILLGGTAYMLTFLLALVFGILCVYYEQSLFDRLMCKIGTVFTCIPSFWLALLLILIFSVNMKIFPSGGAYTIGKERSIGDTIKHLVLPLSVLIIEHLWYYAYLLRNRLIEETRKDYVIFALSKGVPKWKVLCVHCLKSAMPSYLSLMAVSVPHILGGTYIVESVFSYPGLGRLCFESAKYHDYNLLMTLAMLTAVFVVITSMLARQLSEVLDPSMRRERLGGQIA